MGSTPGNVVFVMAWWHWFNAGCNPRLPFSCLSRCTGHVEFVIQCFFKCEKINMDEYTKKICTRNDTSATEFDVSNS